jgi:photosystem II stability/assembly factor-like uncharacterized protein
MARHWTEGIMTITRKHVLNGPSKLRTVGVLTKWPFSLAVLILACIARVCAAQGQVSNVWSPAGCAGETQQILIDPQNSFNLYCSVIDPPSLGGTGHIFKSSDKGASWQLMLSRAGSLSLSMNPLDTSIIYAGTSAGLLRTNDGGSSWALTGLQIPIQLVSVAPANPEIIYAVDALNTGKTSLFVSTDQGLTWVARVLPYPSFAVSTLYVDRLVDERVIISMADWEDTALLSTFDRGRSWNDFTIVKGPPLTCLVIDDPRDLTTIYALTVAGVYKSFDRGTTWTYHGRPLDTVAHGLAIDPADGTLYAATKAEFSYQGDGVYRSKDDGATWEPFNSGLANLNIRGIAFDNASRVLYAATRAGLFKMNLSETAPLANVSGRVLSPDGRGLRGASVRITETNGLSQTTVSTSLGYFSFAEIEAGHTYTVSVSSKRYRYATKTITVADTITDLNFHGIE